MKILLLKAFFILLTVLVFKYVILPKKQVESGLILSIVDDSKTNCLVTAPKCDSDADCSSCYPTLLTWVCSPQKKVCEIQLDMNYLDIPSCADAKGGAVTYENMNYYGISVFKCTCMFPDIYIGRSCDTPNPSICINGVLTSDIKPDLACNCNDSNDSSVMFNGLPYCIPTKFKWFMDQQKKGKIYTEYLKDII